MIYGQALTFGGGVGGEIAITDNGVFDVKKYASANVNVQSAPVLLWTNASPTSAFAAQTVTLPTGYSGYIVEYREDTNNAAYSKAFIEFSAETQASVGGAVRNSSLRAFGRQINSAKDGEIQFGLGLGAVFGGGTGSGNAGDGIPTRIWGVKFTL
jgi:hypothetical protein